MTFILLPGPVSIQGTDSVSMKRDASAASDDASAMIILQGHVPSAYACMVHLYKVLGSAIGALAMASLVMIAMPNAAQSQAGRNIRLIISVPPGGSIDHMARILADHISSTKGQSIIIEIRPAAGGVIAAEAVARAQPDGTTLLINN